MPSGCQDVESSTCARTECGSTAIIEASGVQQSQGVAVSERGCLLLVQPKWNNKGAGATRCLYCIHLVFNVAGSKSYLPERPLPALVHQQTSPGHADAMA